MDGKKSQIIATANRLFSEKGYTNTSVEEIAKESGMAKASFYKIFSSKEELLLESMLQFSRNIESGLKKLVDQPALSPKERLHQCAQIYMNTICDNNIHLLLLNFSDVITFENETINDVGLMIEQSFNGWLTECLVYIYGEEVQAFAMDVAFVVRSIVSEYVRMLGPRVSALTAINYNVFISFIETIIDICIQGMIERKSEYIPLWQISDWIDKHTGASPVLKKAQAKRALLEMERIIDAAEMPEAEKNEYLQIILQLNEEVPSPRAGTGLLKACLLFLEQMPALQNGCAELRAVYGLVSSR